jgi:hypothetical protein
MCRTTLNSRFFCDSLYPRRAIGVRCYWWVLCALIFAWGAASQGSEPLRVQAQVGSGPYFVGQGFELRINVTARSRRPKIDLPPIPGASAWLIGTELRPISRSSIGSIVEEENVYIFNFRMVARRAGTLQIPSILARVESDSGRSQTLHVEILPVPAVGRPAAFLGGIGRLSLTAEAVPKVVRVGQEIDFRVKVSGPAAWGMTGRPELTRYERFSLGLRIKPGPIETNDEPPERTFVYRLRPSRAGEDVLPPVAIATFDPSLSRYVTQVTPGVPIRVAAVAAFDPATIDDGKSARGQGRSVVGPWTVWILSAVALVATYASLILVRRRGRRGLSGTAAARQYAARLARTMASVEAEPGAAQSGSDATVAPTDDFERPGHLAARRVSDGLIHYLQLGADRPPGALTPQEARQGVASVTRSEDLGGQAGRLTAHCDLILYGGGPGERSAREILEGARALFEALGKVKTSRPRIR